jgi:hypothetical protein
VSTSSKPCGVWIESGQEQHTASAAYWPLPLNKLGDGQPDEPSTSRMRRLGDTCLSWQAGWAAGVRGRIRALGSFSGYSRI